MTTWSRDVCGELSTRLSAATEAGISPDRVVLDPGLGFAKTGAHNWSVLAQLQTSTPWAGRS